MIAIVVGTCRYTWHICPESVGILRIVFSHFGFVHIVFIIDKCLILFPLVIINTSEVEELEMRAVAFLRLLLNPVCKGS